MKIIKDIFYDGELSLDVYLPDNKSFKTFIYIHGGGLEAGSKEDAKPFAPYLAKRGIATFSINYRMYPTARYPEFIEDCAKAVSWITSNLQNYGNCTEIYIGGSSAGGYISQMLCFDKRYLGKYGLVPTDFAGFVLDAGQPTCHFNVLRERGIDGRRIIVDESAALYHIGTDEKYPSMLIIYSDNDMQNRPEQTVLLVSTLKHFGHVDNVTAKMMHGNHCEYVNKMDEQGESVFGKLIYEYIK